MAFKDMKSVAWASMSPTTTYNYNPVAAPKKRVASVGLSQRLARTFRKLIWRFKNALGNQRRV